MQRILIGSTIACLAFLLLLTSGCSDNHSSSLPRGTNVFTLRVLQDGTPCAPAWVAIQDGDGPWRIWSPTDTGRFTAALTNPEGRYSLALVTKYSDVPEEPSQLTLYHGTVAELPEVCLNLPSSESPTMATVTGTFNRMDATDDVAIAAGRSTYLYTPQNGDTYTIDVPSGRHDIMACLWPSSADYPRKFAMRRNRMITGLFTEDPIDFAAEPDAETATIHLANGGVTRGYLWMVTDDGTTLCAAAARGESPRTSFPCAFPAPVQRDASDIYYADFTDATSGVALRQSFTGEGDRTLTLPSPLGTVTAGLITTGAMPVPTATWAAYTADCWEIKFKPLTRGVVIQYPYTAYVTKGWLRGATSYTLPDALANLDGWNPVFTINGTSSILASVTAYTTNLPIATALTFPHQPMPTAGYVTAANATSAQ